MEGETRYAAATAGDSKAMVDWEKLADLELNYEAIHHTVTMYEEHEEFIKSKLANKKLLFKVNGDEETALHLAARRGHINVLNVLISAARLLAFASPSADDDIHSSHQLSLLDNFVWHPNRYKDTALHLALIYNNEDIAFNLAYGSPPRYGQDLRNHLGQTPVYLAVKCGYKYVVNAMGLKWNGRVPLYAPDGYPNVLHAAIVKFGPGMHYILTPGFFFYLTLESLHNKIIILIITF